jgi:hypothetical protein
MRSAIAENHYCSVAIIAAKLANLPRAFFPAKFFHRVQTDKCGFKHRVKYNIVKYFAKIVFSLHFPKKVSIFTYRYDF